MSIDLVAGIDDIVDTLKALEFKGSPLRVFTRLEDVQSPCVWVALESIDHTIGNGEQLLRLFLVSGAPDEYRAIKELGPLLELVVGVVSPTEQTTVVGVQLTTQQRPLPALRVTTSTLI